MNKAEFISKLARRLHSLPKDEIKETLAYYSEVIDDRMEDGMSEYAAVSDLGNLDKIAEETMLDATPVSAFIFPKKSLSGSNLWMLILCSPLIILLFTVIALFYVSVWLMIASLFLIDLSFVLAGLAGVLAAIIDFNNNISLNIWMFIGGLLSIGIGIVIFKPVKKISWKVWGFTTWFMRSIKIILMRKKDE